MGAANFVALVPQQRAALIGVSQDTLRYAYHIRYELLEFAVYVLAARVQGLVPLHAACVGRCGQSVLLMGASGSGKSTVVLHALLSGLDFLAEDSVLVTPTGLLATGVANFIHVRPDTLRFLAAADRSAVVRKASVIRRRSGVEKLEIDLRRPGYQLAAAPLRIRAVVFMSSRSAGSPSLLTPLRRSVVLQRLAASQALRGKSTWLERLHTADSAVAGIRAAQRSPSARGGRGSAYIAAGEAGAASTGYALAG